MNKFTAIVLAAGSGKRMEQDIPKQYMNIGGAPLMVHCLRAFQESKVTQIVLVVAPGDVEKCRTEIVERYNISKCVAIVEGGEERYNSVYAGLQAINDGYVLIHDCARAFVPIDVIHRCMSAVTLYESCVVGMPSKDTVKITDSHRLVLDTPDRSKVWIVQTPQCFEYNLIREAYDKITVTKICLNAGIGRGTFYTYYSDKNILLVDCFKEMRENAKSYFHQLQLSNNKANDLIPAVYNLIEAMQYTSSKISDKRDMLMANGYIQSEYFRYVNDMMVYFENLYNDVLSLRYDRERLNAFLSLGMWGFMNIKTDSNTQDTMTACKRLIEDLYASNIFIKK